MTTSQVGRQRIEQREGFVGNAYQDGGGVWTIGYGHTGGVHQGMTCTQAQADLWLTADLAVAESAVDRLVRVALNQHQFDALVSLVVNIGSGNFSSSHVLYCLNACDYADAAQHFLDWDKIQDKVSDGLLNRRKSEQAQFLNPIGGGDEV